MFRKNVHFKPYEGTGAWRKLAIASWRSAGDPSIYGWYDIDAGGINKTIERLRADGLRITPTVIAAKAIAKAIEAYPTLNSVRRFGKAYERKTIDIFLQVAPDDSGENLSGMVIRDCNNKSLEEITHEIREGAGKIKSGEDEDFKKLKKRLNHIPSWLLKPMMKFVGFLSYGLNWWIPALGSPRDGFGSAMVTSVGMLGLQRGFAPLFPNVRCPMIVAIGKIEDQPVVKNGEVVAGKILPVCITLDHRLIDGVGASKMLKTALAYFEQPD